MKPFFNLIIKNKMKIRIIFLISFLSSTILKGQTAFQKTYYGDVAFDFERSVKQTNDDGFTITGTISNIETVFGVYLVKTNSAENSGCDETKPITIVSSNGTQNNVGVVTSTITTQSLDSGTETKLCIIWVVNDDNTEQLSVSVFPNLTQNILNI